MEDPKGSAQPSGRLVDHRLLDLLTLLEPVDEYLREVKRISASEATDAQEKMRQVRERGIVLLAEMERHFTTLIRQTGERRRELQDLVKPPSPDLFEQMQQLLRQVSALTEKIALRERLSRQWEKATAEEIGRAYEERLAAGDLATAELFESYAEAILEQKGNAAALAAFRERRERARESRLTPEQVRGKQELEDLLKFETSVSLMRTGLAAMLKLYEGPFSS